MDKELKKWEKSLKLQDQPLKGPIHKLTNTAFKEKKSPCAHQGDHAY